jgi:hypothetical protein
MYGLPQAGRLSQLRLISHLAKHGYHQSPTLPASFSTRLSILPSVWLSTTSACDTAHNRTLITSLLPFALMTTNSSSRKTGTRTLECTYPLAPTGSVCLCQATSTKLFSDSDPSTYSQLTEPQLHPENTTPPSIPAFNSSKKINLHSSPRLNAPKSKPSLERFYTTPAPWIPHSCPSQMKSHPNRPTLHRKS